MKKILKVRPEDLELTPLEQFSLDTFGTTVMVIHGMMGAIARLFESAHYEGIKRIDREVRREVDRGDYFEEFE